MNVPNVSHAAARADVVGSWRELAACADNVHAFYVGRGESLAAAYAMCHACPVLAECRAACDAEESSEMEAFGFRAGETVRQRFTRRRRTKVGAFPCECGLTFTTAGGLARHQVAKHGRARAACGTNSGFQRGCRCDDCREAHNEEMRRYRASKKDEAVLAECPYCPEKFAPKALGPHIRWRHPDEATSTQDENKEDSCPA